MKNIGIYIHIPFCKRKCFYCDFCSFETNANLYKEYVDCLIEEIKNCNVDNKEVLIKTIYIGGGTPSIIDEKYIELIISALKDKFNFGKKCEMTIEVNPGTANIDKLKKYKEIGINRLSIGLQTTNDRLLNLIGRIHNFSEFENVYDIARSVGFENVNVDLMIGLPTQTIDDVVESLDKIIKKNPEHISVYSLILEEGTKLEKMVKNRKIAVLEDELERDMYWTVKRTLEQNGYNHYEISNFAKSGFESKHNTDCWKQHEYLGFGLSAHSYFNDIRYSNICDISKYISNIKNRDFEKNVEINEIQDVKSKENEFIILGLRMLKGVNIDSFYKIFNEKPTKMYAKQIEKLTNQGLIKIENGNIKLTDKGIDFANMVWSEFI